MEVIAFALGLLCGMAVAALGHGGKGAETPPVEQQKDEKKAEMDFWDRRFAQMENILRYDGTDKGQKNVG